MKTSKPTVEGRKAERVLREAVSKVMEQSRKLGRPVAVMKDGKAVLISADRAVAAVRESRRAYAVRRK